VSDRELFEFRNRSRQKLVDYVRERLKVQVEIRGSAETILAKVPNVLDPNVLTIGFARRFAEYKRPNLILRDIDRLVRIMNNASRPVQLIVAGKAHPGDNGGKALIKAMADAADREDIYEKLVFLVDYDMGMTQQLAAGVDVWLNNPRRPMEACGTSGMKVLVNGGLNLSELDGWWAEAYSPEVGWALGDGREHNSDPAWDEHEAEQLYSLLENEIVPEFYDRDADGLPRKWLARIRASMTQLTPRFSSQRMVREYVEKYYFPAASAFHRRSEDKGREVEGLVEWARGINDAWSRVKIVKAELRDVKGVCEAKMTVDLGVVSPDDVRAELYADPVGDRPMQVIELTPHASLKNCYTGSFPINRPLREYTGRIVVRHPGVFIPQEVSNICWGT
jgi:starch phosphorylase